MRALLPHLLTWIDRGEPFALATIVATEGSAPRQPGSGLLISADGERFVGAVSSGCLELEVVAAAQEVLRTGGIRHLHFGPEGQPPWRDGLTCGGRVKVRVEPWWGGDPRSEVRALAPLVRGWLERDEPGVVLSRDREHLAFTQTGPAVGTAAAFTPELVAQARTRLLAEAPPGEIATADGPVFCRTVRRRPRLLLVGAVDIAAHLVALARECGFATTVVDPRQPYAQAERFPGAPDRLIRGWPQPVIAETAWGPRDAAVVLSHDPKIDDAALLALLETRVGYLGALGSQRSHAARLERLRSAGAEAARLMRIHGPAGLPLGTGDAVGIALGILTGIVQWQAAGRRPTPTP